MFDRRIQGGKLFSKPSKNKWSYFNNNSNNNLHIKIINEVILVKQMVSIFFLHLDQYMYELLNDV